MPQKRNPFLLEHVKGRSARAAGAFVASTTAMHATPFANSVAVGTEGCTGVIEALDAAADSVTLLRLVVAGAKPRPGAMLARAVAGHTTATAAAARLVMEKGVSFREAHHLVGRLLTESDDGVGTDSLDPVSVANAACYGGGPGAPAVTRELLHRRAAIAAELVVRLRRWRRADIDLAAAVDELLGRRASGPAAVLAKAGRTP